MKNLNEPDPLKPEDAEKLIRILELIAEKMKQLLTQGCAIDEGCGDDPRVSTAQKRIRHLRDELAKESDRLQDVKSAIRRRKCSMSKSK